MPQRTCVITGASRGIGLATARRFAAKGFAIVGAARHEAELAKALEQIGTEVHPVLADVAVPQDLEGLIATAVERFGRVDVLVNNAGRAPLAPIESLAPDEFDRVTAVNMTAVYRATRAVWPHMLAQGGGVIVNISSLSSVDPFPGLGVYGASKAWVNLFSRAMAAEGKGHGIRVYAVAPGAVRTQMLRSLFPEIPAAQTLDPDEVAAVIESACDPSLAPVSGETLFVRK